MRDVMVPITEYTTITENQSVGEAANRMMEIEVPSLLMVEQEKEQQKVLGVLRDQDLFLIWRPS